METTENQLHSIQVIDHVLLRKLLGLLNQINELLVLVHAPEYFGVYLNKQIVVAEFLLLLNQALNSARKDSQHGLGVGPLHDELLCGKPTSNSFFEAVYKVYYSGRED